MSDSEPEIGIEEARGKLGALADDARHHRITTHLTRNGKRVASIVPAAPWDPMTYPDAPDPSNPPCPHARETRCLAQALLHAARQVGDLDQATERQLGELTGILTAIHFVTGETFGGTYGVEPGHIAAALDWAGQVDAACAAWTRDRMGPA